MFLVKLNNHVVSKRPSGNTSIQNTACGVIRHLSNNKWDVRCEITYLLGFITSFTIEANHSKQTWFSIKFWMDLLFPQRWSFIYTGVSVIIRRKITVGGTTTVYTHLSASSFPDRMAQIEQGMLGKLPSLSSSSSRSLQRTDPVVQRCLEEDTEKDDGAGAGFDCKRNVEQVKELEWDQIYSDRRLKTLRRKGVKEPCTDSAVVRELHRRPEKCKTWVSFN